MGSFISNIIGSIAMYVVSIYMWKKLYNKSICCKNVYFYIWSILIVFAIILNYFYNFVFIRIFFSTLIMTFANRIIFRQDYKSTIFSTVFSELILTIADMSYGIIVIYLLKVDISNLSSFYGTLFGNLYVFVVSFCIVNFGVVRRVYNFLLSFVNNLNSRRVIFMAILLIISLDFLLAITFFKSNFYVIFFVNLFLIFIYSYVVFKNIQTFSRSELIKSENNSLLKSLRQYEDMVDRQRVDNHENKNQLLIIKNMINKNDKDVVKYIDTIIKNQKEDDEALYTRVMTIPSGGLQGIIYQKMLVMRDEHIKFSLDVGRGVRNFELDKLSMDDNYRLCKIIGVFLDNAIEESLTVDNRCIMISLYVDGKDLIIEVSNRFKGKVDVDRLDESGYTTKGDGHGYGLPLVKKILSETDTFVNERSVKRNIFKQVIRIKNT